MSANASQLLKTLNPALTSQVLAQTGRTAESRDSVVFGFHPWCPIPNVELKGFLFGVHHVVLKRMCLIDLKLYVNPDIQPRIGGFAVGAITAGGAFPSGAVGSKVEPILQYPSQSARNLLEAYGKDGANNIGFTILRSLGSDTDIGKLEAILLFRAVMETPIEDGAPCGVDYLLEDLPKFLAGDATKLLIKACSSGIDLGDEVYKFSKAASARVKGERMIDDITASIAAATRRALDENSGILPQTKKDLIASAKGLRDVKVQMDELDYWLSRQFPSYSMDTDVERATRANRSVTEAIRESGQGNADTLQQLLIMQQQTLEQLRLANETNVRLLNERQKPAA